MYTESKPDGTVTIIFQDEEREVVDAYAKMQGVSTRFFIACALQTTIRNITDLFPRKLLMPGYLDRHIMSREIVEKEMAVSNV